MKSKSASTAAADHQLHQLHQLQQHHHHHHQNLFNTSGGGQLLSPVGSSSQQHQLNLGNGALTAAQILNYAAQLTGNGNGKGGPLDPSSSNSWDPAVALQNSDCSNAAALAQLNAASQLIAASLLQQQQANSLQESIIR